MAPKRTSMLAGAQHAVRDLFNVVLEINEWRHERDAFVAPYLAATATARSVGALAGGSPAGQPRTTFVPPNATFSPRREP
jgi:hypothetical protein